MRLLSSQSGAVSLPLVLLLSVGFTASFGSWALLRTWHRLTSLQLRLDACVARTAEKLRTTQTQIEAANTRLKISRAAQLAGVVLPEALPALRAAAEVDARLQDLLLLNWQRTRVSWLLKRGCDAQADRPIALPELPWVRNPRDSLGPGLLRWTGEPEVSGKRRPRFVVELHHFPRASAAEVHTETQETDAIGQKITLHAKPTENFQFSEPTFARAPLQSAFATPAAAWRVRWRIPASRTNPFGG